MSREEFDNWEWVLCTEGGYFSQESGLPAVEELEVEEAPAGAKVDRTLGSEANSLLLTVENVGKVAIPKLSVHWVWTCENPQPVKLGGITAHDMGGGMSLMPEQGFDGTPMPGESRRFLLAPQAIESVSSQVAALSPERYRVEVRSGDQVIEHIPGAVVGAEVEAFAG